MERLDKYNTEAGAWQEIVLEDKHAGLAEVAATRIDFDAWFRSLPCRLRRMAKFLARVETTGAAAEKYRVSAARVSQIRRELKLVWQRFAGDQPTLSRA